MNISSLPAPFRIEYSDNLNEVLDSSKDEAACEKSDKLADDDDLNKQLLVTHSELDNLHALKQTQVTNEVQLLNNSIYLEFAKDAFFYYLTAKKKQKRQHLRTLIDLFKYNEKELKKINDQSKLINLFR